MINSIIILYAAICLVIYATYVMSRNTYNSAISGVPEGDLYLYEKPRQLATGFWILFFPSYIMITVHRFIVRFIKGETTLQIILLARATNSDYDWMKKTRGMCENKDLLWWLRTAGERSWERELKFASGYDRYDLNIEPEELKDAILNAEFSPYKDKFFIKAFRANILNGRDIIIGFWRDANQLHMTILSRNTASSAHLKTKEEAA